MPNTPLTPSIENLAQDVIQILKNNGPLLGKELVDHIDDANNLQIWQACFTSNNIFISHFSRYYLRYDITREDSVRLSPSILRDFLSFTLLSTDDQRDRVIERQVTLSNHHRKVSMAKTKVARNILRQIMRKIPQNEHQIVCAFLAGDIAYFLAHLEPREVASIGEMVNGSDIDIIIIHDGLSPETIELIDQEMMSFKNFYLRHPEHREEVDYICKSKETMFDQLAYSDINEQIASKIAYESVFLAGSVELFAQIKNQVEASGTKDLIERDFLYGLEERKQAMRTLLKTDASNIDANTESLFFFSQERVEFQ